MRFRPTVLAVQPNRELRWKGKLLVPGLFDGEHYFKLEAKPAGGLTFHQGELFSGILVPLFRRSLDGATKQGFVAMNDALKREAEEPRSNDANIAFERTRKNSAPLNLNVRVSTRTLDVQENSQSTRRSHEPAAG